MIITKEMLLYSNGCMRQVEIDQAQAVGVVIGETTVSDGVVKLHAAGHTTLAAWLRLAGHRWAVKNAGVVGVVYHVFNPTTGQHIDALTLEDAMRLRQEMIDEFVKSSLLLFSIIEETVANTGESSTRTVDVEAELAAQSQPQ